MLRVRYEQNSCSLLILFSCLTIFASCDLWQFTNKDWIIENNQLENKETYSKTISHLLFVCRECLKR